MSTLGIPGYLPEYDLRYAGTYPSTTKTNGFWYAGTPEHIPYLHYYEYP